ncbi:STAS domain-containing protein [Streptomyces sp. NPDC050211]|uniref:STAS domain-containing protein n=1 Tax=Streptomyces sp. NPDC050211 TaxID=3154932 RepID=UPI00343ED96F
MSGTMQVDLKTTGPGRCLVVVSGELDLVTATDARQALKAAVDQHRSVVVDLGQVTFCDCTGLSALLAAARAARGRGVELRLRAVPHFLARILRLTGTHGAFSIEPAPPVHSTPGER